MNQKSIIVILGVVIIILISTTVYFATINKASQLVAPAANVVQQVDETTNWQTHKDEKNSYEIKYPKNWFVDNKNSKQEITYWSNYEDATSYVPGVERPNDLQVLSLQIFKSSINDTLDDFLIKNKFPFGQKERFDINGANEGVRLVFINMEDGKVEYLENILIKTSDEVFVFSNSGGANSEEAKISKSILDKMISTFKFTK